MTCSLRDRLKRLRRAPIRLGVIDRDAYEAAARDPKVQRLVADARAYGEELVAQGHCPCHLVVNCPDRKPA
jgi:hypothetical protein